MHYFSGFRSNLASKFTPPTSSSPVSGWETLDTTVYYNGQSNESIVNVVRRSGRYVVTFNAVTKFNNTSQEVTAQVLINGQVRITGVVTGKQAHIPLSSTLKLAINDTIQFLVKGSSFPPTLLENRTSRSMGFVSPLSTVSGAMSVFTKTALAVSGQTTVMASGLHGDGGNGYFLDDNSTLVNNEAIAIIKPGFYRINAHFIIRNDGSDT